MNVEGIPTFSVNLISLAIVFSSKIEAPPDRPPLDTPLVPLSEINDTLSICEFVSYLLICVCVGVCVGGGAYVSVYSEAHTASQT